MYFLQVEFLLDEEGWKDEAKGVIKDIEAYVKVNKAKYQGDDMTIVISDCECSQRASPHQQPDIPQPRDQGGQGVHGPAQL